MNLRKDTAKRMLSNIDMQLKALAAEQQSINGNKGGTRMIRGGRVKMQARGDVPGGYTNSFLTKDLFKQPYKTNFGTTPLPEIDQFQMRDLFNLPMAIKPENLARTYDTGKYVVPGEQLMNVDTQLGSFNNPSQSNIGFSNPLDDPNSREFDSMASRAQTFGGAGKGNFDWSSLTGLIGPAFNTLAGAFTKQPDRLNPEDYQNPYESQALAMMPTQFDINPQLNQVRNQYANYVRNINNTGLSRGERQANYASGMNRANESRGELYSQKFNEENRMRANKAQFMAGLGDRRARTKLQVSDMDLANQSAARNMRRQYLGAAAEGVSNWSLINKQMANQKLSQDAYVKALMRRSQFMPNWTGLEGYKYGLNKR